MITTALARISELDDLEAFHDAEVRLAVNGDYLVMFGGPTGYESASAADLARDVAEDRGWMACAGTPGRWRRCFVPAAELRRALADLGIR